MSSLSRRLHPKLDALVLRLRAFEQTRLATGENDVNEVITPELPTCCC